MTNKLAKRVIFFLCIGMPFGLVVSRTVILKNIFSTAFYPLLIVQQKALAPIKQWYGARSARRGAIEQLQQELARYKLCNEQLRAENVVLHGAAIFYQQTKELLEFKERYADYSTHCARVLVRSFSRAEQFFLVDGGTNHGVQVGMAAIYKNYLVGRVVEVYPWYCKVSLISNAQTQIAVCGAKSGLQGIYEGGGMCNTAKLNEVSHLQPLVNQELLISTGQGLVFPAGFGVAAVATSNLNGLYWDIAVQPLVDFKAIEFCVILKHRSG